MLEPIGEYEVHPTAEVEPGAQVGERTRIWRYAHVRSGASIGSDCSIGANVFIDVDVRVGDRTKIQNNVSVYAGVMIEDEVFVGPSVVFTNDLRPRAVSPTWSIVPTFVRRGASVGANATLICGREVGEFAMVAAGSVVTRAVRPHQLVAGNPARPLGWVCYCGDIVGRDLEPPEDLLCHQCAASGVGRR